MIESHHPCTLDQARRRCHHGQRRAFGPFSIAANIAFSNGTNGINLSVSGHVDLPGGIDVDLYKFDIVNGQLADIGIRYNAVAPSLGVPIADTGFYLTGLSGELDNLNNPSQIVVSAVPRRSISARGSTCRAFPASSPGDRPRSSKPPAASPSARPSSI